MKIINNSTIATKSASISLNADDILRIQINEDIIFDKNDMFDLIEGAKIIGNGRKFKNLIVTGEGSTADTDARNLSASKEGCQYKIADAFVINSIPQKFLMNIYIRLQKPTVPTRFFFKEEEALNWLKTVA